MDRNFLHDVSLDYKEVVALRKESVDRNGVGSWRLAMILLSLSARRAWIEMDTSDVTAKTGLVALRKESVDRNGCLKLLETLIP